MVTEGKSAIRVTGDLQKFQLLLMKTQAVFARREIALEGIKKQDQSPVFSAFNKEVCY